MKEVFQLVVLKCCLVGLGGIALVLFCGYVVPSLVRGAADYTRRYVRLGLVGMLVVGMCMVEVVLYGGGKNNPTNNPAPPLCGRFITQGGNAGGIPSNVESGLSRIDKWSVRGAWEDGQIVEFDDDWCFPLVSNHLSAVELWSNGKLFASEQDELPFAELSTPLALVPGESEVRVGRTTNNSYRFEWWNAHPNRDANSTTNAVIELFRNGDIEVTEGGVTLRFNRELPFPHDGFGQDEDWICANFTNAAEIIACGYSSWVDGQIGVGLTNGLYKFTAEFLSDPPEPTLLYVGDMSIVVTNAGEYVFVMEKGVEYEFGTWPSNDGVLYGAQDDMGDNMPMLMSLPSPGDGQGEWSIDGGWSWLECPYGSLPGSVGWLPILQGSPNVGHLGPSDFPKTFTAELLDYCGNGGVVYQWASSDDNVHLSSPNARSTQVYVGAMPSWKGVSIWVDATIGGHVLRSYLSMSYGNNDVPQVRVEVLGPDHVWVNSPSSDGNLRTMAVSVSSDVPTSGTFRVSFSGNDNHLGITRIGNWELPVYEINTIPVVHEFARLEGLSPCSTCGEERFGWTFQTADGEVLFGTNAVTVCKIDTVALWSQNGPSSVGPTMFPGQMAATFCVTNSANPDLHYPIFFCDVVDTNICIQPYSVEYRVTTLPEDFECPGAMTSLELIDGPASGVFQNASGKTAHFGTTREGGVYKVGVRYSDSPITETILVLPLAGASVDAVVLADRAKADVAVAYIISHVPALKRQWPGFGLKWFNDKGMGDYLGRVDSLQSSTVWLYNQVNDDTGMGAVATWRGLPIRMAKISNFLVGYTTKRIGVWSVSRGVSQSIGTDNDESATLSWDAGVQLADGANYDAVTGSMVTNAWKVADQKERRLWPNVIPTDNHVPVNAIRNYNMNFISPGFTERIPQ